MTISDISLIRGTSLSGYVDLVTELGGDPDALLRTAGIRPENVGVHDAFITYRGLVVALESAAAVTRTRDFGRQLALRQGIEILGPLGVAARTSHTVGDAFETFETYLAAYSPAISTRMTPTEDPARCLFEFQILQQRLPPHSQVTELSLGVILRVFRLLLGPNWSPLSVHLTHEALTPRRDYVDVLLLHSSLRRTGRRLRPTNRGSEPSARSG